MAEWVKEWMTPKNVLLAMALALLTVGLAVTAWFKGLRFGAWLWHQTGKWYDECVHRLRRKDRSD